MKPMKVESSVFKAHSAVKMRIRLPGANQRPFYNQAQQLICPTLSAHASIALALKNVIFSGALTKFLK